MSKRTEWLEQLIADIPVDTADYEYLVTWCLPRLRLREIQALHDAIMLARRDGRKALGE